jgi:multisubunit Na+/H+ antiporter MnhB subunit
MNILFFLLFIFLVFSSSGVHTYFVWKKKDYRTLKVHIAIIVFAILSGIILIFMPDTYSITNILNELSPLNN